MYRLISIIGLEVYALLLAWSQSLQHVRTDEAKYLLNIPYPHPPFVRTVLGLTDGWLYQEMFWRIVFATLMVQAVWLVWDLGKTLRISERLLISLCWLLSGGVMLQAGAVLMAPLTAVQMLFFVWLYLRDVRLPAGLIAVFWLGALFTAFQAVLFLPIVWTLLSRASRGQEWPRYIMTICFFGPIFLLVLYTLSNPLALASMVIHTEREGMSITSRFLSTVHLWFIGGSVMLSILGTYGLFVSRKWPLILTFLLVFAYIVVGPHPYYTILFVPLLVAGAFALFRAQTILRHGLFLTVIGTALIVWSMLPLPPASPARATMTAIRESGIEGAILINGSFGHEWQYESPYPVQRYVPDISSQASAIICLESCNDLDARNWAPLVGAPMEVFMRR